MVLPWLLLVVFLAGALFGWWGWLASLVKRKPKP